MIYVHFSGQSGGSTGLKNEHKSLTKLTFCLNKKLNFVNDFLKNIAVLQILIPEYTQKWSKNEDDMGVSVGEHLKTCF